MRTIFLDRDGVINEDFGYVYKWADFKFIEGSLKALQILTKNKFNIIIVTNQAGIAKGFYTEADFKKLNSEFLIFCLQKKIRIMDIFFCPHHIDAVIPEYNKFCKNRKPESGMFFKASKIYNIKLETCIMIGDNITDIIASNNAGIKENYLVNYKNKNLKPESNLNFKFKKSFLTATKEILKNKNS
tara:strand:+ start:111 stop:668 length:558 start_codon:yes stop_codon:yes gene_type:complete